MRRRSATFDAWDVVVVPFPFSERPGSKRRPALVLSRASFRGSGHAVLAMVTTRGHRPWPGDTELDDPGAAGLDRPCMVRLKIFTLDGRLIVRRAGSLARGDRARVRAALRSHLVA